MSGRGSLATQKGMAGANKSSKPLHPPALSEVPADILCPLFIG